MRTIHLHDQEWSYKIGKENIVIIAPNKTKSVVHFTDLLNIPWFDFEKTKSKGGSYEVRPGDIKKYIIDHQEKLCSKD